MPAPSRRSRSRAAADGCGSTFRSACQQDGDGVPDALVGSYQQSVFVLFMNRNGTVRSEAKITSSAVAFGRSVALLGDVDNDGVADALVGAPDDIVGKAYVVLLKADGTAKRQVFVGISPGDFAYFGTSVAGLGDVVSAASRPHARASCRSLRSRAVCWIRRGSMGSSPRQLSSPAQLSCPAIRDHGRLLTAASHLPIHPPIGRRRRARRFNRSARRRYGRLRSWGRVRGVLGQNSQPQGPDEDRFRA